MNSYIGLRDRIKGYLATGDPTETITLIEDELEEIFDCIVEEIGDDYFMCGNGVISGFTKRGYIITSDSGQRILASFAAFKGDRVSKGDRVQYNAAYLYEDRNICLDFMKCMTLEDLKYHMFSCIENRDMVRASSFAWAIYDGASETFKNAMKLCIHTLRNYMKRLDKDVVLN